MKWYVIQTDCYPKAYRVSAANNADNSARNYFLTEEQAQSEADKRNKKIEQEECEECEGTGIVGDLGPGVYQNEWYECECGAKPDLTQFHQHQIDGLQRILSAQALKISQMGISREAIKVVAQSAAKELKELKEKHADETRLLEERNKQLHDALSDLVGILKHANIGNGVTVTNCDLHAAQDALEQNDKG